MNPGYVVTAGGNQYTEIHLIVDGNNAEDAIRLAKIKLDAVSKALEESFVITEVKQMRSFDNATNKAA